MKLINVIFGFFFFLSLKSADSLKIIYLFLKERTNQRQSKLNGKFWAFCGNLIGRFCQSKSPDWSGNGNKDQQRENQISPDTTWCQSSVQHYKQSPAGVGKASRQNSILIPLCCVNMIRLNKHFETLSASVDVDWKCRTHEVVVEVFNDFQYIYHVISWFSRSQTHTHTHSPSLFLSLSLSLSLRFLVWLL